MFTSFLLPHTEEMLSSAENENKKIVYILVVGAIILDCTLVVKVVASWLASYIECTVPIEIFKISSERGKLWVIKSS